MDGLVGGAGSRILDAGCGTGRVAIELARRGYDTVGVDVDPDLLARARAKAPTLTWIEGDLAALPPDVAPGPFAAAVLAGNVMIFVAPGTEGAVLANVATRLAPGGLVDRGLPAVGSAPARRVRRPRARGRARRWSNAGRRGTASRGQGRATTR